MSNAYIGCNVVVWGVFLMLQGATTNFGVLFALRFSMGKWYTVSALYSTHNNQKRDVRVLRRTHPYFDHIHVL